MAKINSVVLSPNYNAVKIDINNPEVKVPQPQPQPKEECKTCTNPVYDYPKTSLYEPKTTEVKPEMKPEIKPDVKPDVKPEVKAEVKPEVKPTQEETPKA